MTTEQIFVLIFFNVFFVIFSWLIFESYKDTIRLKQGLEPKDRHKKFLRILKMPFLVPVKIYRTTYKWWTTKQERTWYAHPFVCILVSVTAGIISLFLTDDTRTTHLTMVLASLAMFLFFLFREMGDEDEHRADGSWLRRKVIRGTNREDVTPEQDRAGDLVGPFTFFFGNLVVYYITYWRS